MLWFVEGVTDYYTFKLFLKNNDFSDFEYKFIINYFISFTQTIGGYKVMPLEQSGTDIWMLFYSDNLEYDSNEIFANPYKKGAIMGLFMDVFMVNATGGKKSLDDFLHTLDRFCTSNNRGYTKAEFWQMYKEMCGCDVSQLLKYVETTEDLDYDKMLQPVGWKVNKTTWKIEEVANPTATQLKYRAIVAK
jgi:predicted metalloprotease with PDZ domain